MNRMGIASAASAALLTMGCEEDWVVGANDPSTFEHAPAGMSGIPPLETLVARWTPGDGPWSRYNKLTLLASLERRDIALPEVESSGGVPEARRAAQALAEAGLSADTLWMIDLRGAASVAFAASLSQQAREPVTTVVTFNNWPDEGELVPAEITAAAMVRMAPKQASANTPGARPVFLLDAWRLAYPHAAIDDEVFDNRYMINPADLPAPEVLAGNGIRRVVYVVESIQERDREEDDLHDLFMRYQDAGIVLAIADLAMLGGPALEPVAADDSGVVLRPLVIFPRHTLAEEPYFYGVAHSRFGVIGRPVFAHPGAGRGGGFGGGHVPAHPGVGHSGHAAAHPSVGRGGFGHGGG